jgi:hypothetical protein
MRLCYFLNFRPKCVSPNVSLQNVTFETRTSCTLIIAHVSPNVSLQNVTFEARCVSSRSLSLMSRPMSRFKMSRLRHAVYRCASSRSLSLMSRSVLWPEYRSGVKKIPVVFFPADPIIFSTWLTVRPYCGLLIQRAKMASVITLIIEPNCLNSSIGKSISTANRPAKNRQNHEKNIQKINLFPTYRP